MKKFTFLIVLLFLFRTTDAQELGTGKPLSLFKASDAYFQFGGFHQGGMDATLNDFKKLAPGSEILKMDLKGFNESNWDDYSYNFAYEASVGFKIRNSEGSAYRRSPTLRVGLLFMNSYPFEKYYSNNTETRFDTLTGSHPGNVVYVDSVYNQSVGMNYNSDQLRLDVSIIFSTNPDARWALYGGFGLNLGTTLNNNTEIFYNTQNYQTYHASEGEFEYYLEDDNYTSITESYRNKSSFSGSFYVPMGIDFRIARRGEFFKRLHLFYEFRAGVNFTNIPEMDSYTSLYLSNQLGIRLNF